MLDEHEWVADPAADRHTLNPTAVRTPASSHERTGSVTMGVTGMYLALGSLGPGPKRGLVLLSGCLTLMACAGRTLAQEPPRGESTESRVTVHALLGAFIPTGANRRAHSVGPYIGAQMGLRVRPFFALVGGVAVAQTTDPRLTGETGVSLWQYDVGAELALAISDASAKRWKPTPFVGAGIGGRSYDYLQNSLGRHDALAGYLSAGGELRPGLQRRAGVRVEGRAYVSHAERGEAGSLRTDVAVAAALTYHFR
ncbi:MAG: hypothetical protein HUU26_00305 [Gemmatimonadaceae bacterium]|nr:hypothetical protein [Gemmatimonadaceae bacterium]